MLPTLNGRIQSRIFFLATIGSFWTAIMCLVLPANGAPLHVKFQDGFVVLLWTAVLGIGWEIIYHLLMQWRWEKDWPTFFGFATIINEGVVVYLLAANGFLPGIWGRDIANRLDVSATDLIPLSFFIPLFVVVWIMVWLWVNGPMRVFNIHWRFFGGRIV